MALVLKMQIDDKQEHQYIFSTGEEGTIELIPLSVVANGRYQAPEGKAYNLVSVEVPEIELESLNITQSGTYTAPSGKAYDVVTVDIPEYILDALTATENGTYTPSSGHVYDRVVVNVPSEAPEIQTKSVTYTANGTYTVNKDAGFDGMSSVTVTVNVPTPTPNLQTKYVQINSNGSSVITPDSGYDGMEEVDVTVDVPTPTPNLQTKAVTFTENGEEVILADSGYDGLEAVDVTVNVPTGGGSNDVITGTVTITDTNGYGECWVPITVPAGKTISAVLVRSRTSSINTGPSSWHHSIILWGSIPSMTGDANTRYKQRYSAYLNNATATSFTSEVTKSQSQLSQYLSSTMNSVVAYNSDFGLGFKVKTAQDNTYGFAVNTDYSYIVVLVDSE